MMMNVAFFFMYNFFNITVQVLLTKIAIILVLPGKVSAVLMVIMSLKFVEFEGDFSFFFSSLLCLCC